MRAADQKTSKSIFDLDSLDWAHQTTMGWVNELLPDFEYTGWPVYLENLENLEFSWNLIMVEKTWNSHGISVGIPGKILGFNLLKFLVVFKQKLFFFGSFLKFSA